MRLRLLVTGWLVSAGEIVCTLAELGLAPLQLAHFVLRLARQRHYSDLARQKSKEITL